MSDTFFTAGPDWTWFIIPYFFIGGIAGGSYFIAALLDFRADPRDRAVVRLGYYLAALGVIVSGVLLTLDLGRPERFWHMLVQSQTGALMFKSWSPISFGSWILTLFGAFATASALGALVEAQRLRWRPARALLGPTVRRMIAVPGALLALAFAGYTGILLSVTNRPIWADSTWLGVLFLFSGASTAAAALVLLTRSRAGEAHPALPWLADFDAGALVLELAALIAFLISLGSVVRVFVSGWGVLLLLGVVLAGLLIPLALHWRPEWVSGAPRAHHAVIAATLVLAGGLLLRIVVLLASEGIEVTHAVIR